MPSTCVTQQPPPGYKRLLHASSTACLPCLCIYMVGWIFHCGNQAAAEITFLKPTQIRATEAYLSKSFLSDEQVQPHCFQLQCKGGLILLPGNFLFPQLGAQRQLFSKLKDFQRLKIDLKV